MSGKKGNELKFTPARIAELGDLRKLVATMPGADKNDLVSCIGAGVFDVTGLLDTDAAEAMALVLSEADSMPDAVNSQVILDYLCSQGLIEAATWIFFAE